MGKNTGSMSVWDIAFSFSCHFDQKATRFCLMQIMWHKISLHPKNCVGFYLVGPSDRYNLRRLLFGFPEYKSEHSPSQTSKIFEIFRDRFWVGLQIFCATGKNGPLSSKKCMIITSFALEHWKWAPYLFCSSHCVNDLPENIQTNALLESLWKGKQFRTGAKFKTSIWIT